MKFGYQTILFGTRLHDTEAALRLIAQAGFTGVEFAQRPDQMYYLGKSITITQLRTLLEKCALAFLGLAGGSLQERRLFCEGRDAEGNVVDEELSEPFYPHYLYTEDIGLACVKAEKFPTLRYAIHPHVFMPEDSVIGAARHMEGAPPNVVLIPDTAHMFLKGEEEAALTQVPVERVYALHLKDWDPSFGRSYHRYAKGFVNLDQGVVPVRRCVEVLQAKGFDGWLIAEQDYPNDTIENCIRRAAAWLQNEPFVAEAGEPPFEGCPDIDDLRFQNGLLQAGTVNLERCYAHMATLLQERYQSCGVSIWACSPARDDMCLVALSPPGLRDARDASVLDKRQAVIGSSVDTLAVREYDLNDYPPVWAISARAAGAKTVVTMPVVNRFNHHHIRFLVTLLQPEAGMYDYTQEAVRIGDCLARAADGALDDACAYAAGRVAFLADKVDTLKSFLVALRDLIVERVGCEGVTIFLQNRTGERLEPRETTGLEWAENVLDNERFYRVTDKKHPTVQCWQRNRTELIRKSTRQGRSFEKTSGDHAQADILLVPIMDIIPRSDGTQEQKAIGVIRCRNRRGQPTEREGVKPIFTDDDAAILDTICQTAVPHIELLRSLEERARSLGRIIHEIKKPINALRGKTDRLRTELSRVVPDYKERFRHDYIGQILSWTNISLRVIENGGFYGLASGFQKLEIKPEPTYLMGEVVAPVIGEIGFLLEERGFDASRIRYDRFEDIPRLNIDRNLFQQVFFNLLSNSIKYSYADRNQFGFEIRTARVGRYFCIFCSDWGPGIPEGMERAIFEEGVRGGDELNRYVPGMGLGLWVVREVVEAHGGYVGIESLGQPFTVSLNLPVSLRDSPPRRITR